MFRPQALFRFNFTPHTTIEYRYSILVRKQASDTLRSDTHPPNPDSQPSAQLMMRMNQLPTPMTRQAVKRQVHPLARLCILLLSVLCLFLVGWKPAAATPSSFTGLTALREMAQQSVPYQTALSNGQPTLIEFYADWCTSCQSLAPSVSRFHQKYGSQMNFVMLNVDTPPGSQLIQPFQVKGVPQFFFIQSDHKLAKTLVGRVPESILAQLLEQLINSAS